jgi:hypothetical protein
MHPPPDQNEPTSSLRKFIRFWRNIGGGSLTFSLAIHAGIIVIAGIIVLTTQVIQPEVDFLPGPGTQAGEAASAERTYQIKRKEQSALTRSLSMRRITSAGPGEVVIDDLPISELALPTGSGSIGDGVLKGGSLGSGSAAAGAGAIGNGMATGMVALPASMQGRCAPQARLEKLRQNGGGPQCERAVSISLEWLKGKQNADGSWGKQHKAAMTGLALLCYLGRCEMPDSPFYGDTVMKGILYLVELSQKQRSGLMAEDPAKGSSCYEHGIATYALGEVYTLSRLGQTKLPGMREAFEKGVKIILDSQLEDGGWGYGEGGDLCYRHAGKGDLSVTGWQFQALKAAKHTRLEIKGLHAGITRTLKYLESTQSPQGGFGNVNRDASYNQWNLSGVGILGLQTLGSTKTASVKKGLRFLTEFLTAEPLDWNKNANLYSWYYMTQCYFQQGDADWQFYNAQFLPQLLGNQQPGGDWRTERPNSTVASTSSAGADRDVYRQTLCTLMLEVYYRYLKVADREDDSPFER